MSKVFHWTALLLCLLVAILYQPIESENVFSDLAFHSGLSSSQPVNVLVLTAHPDDECMFFAPTIRALLSRIRTTQILSTQPSDQSDMESGFPALKVQIYSLCLSVGDADALGSIRREELERSLDVLGVDKHNRWVLDHPDLKDNFTAHWSPATIAQVLYPYIIEHRISTILTFDDGGVSGHPNHKSLPEGVLHLLTRHRPPLAAPPPRLLTLITRSLPAKYIGILAPIWSKFTLYQSRLFSLEVQVNPIARGLGSPSILKSSSEPTPFVLVSGTSEYLIALRAMREHASQLVWFRWLYVLFSRYMWVNEWVEVLAVSPSM